jgi:hypothetical protein
MAVTAAQIREIFERHGVPLEFYLNPSGESVDARIARMVQEVNSGQRSILDIEQSVIGLKKAGALGGYGTMEERVAQLFEQSGVPGGFGSTEDAQARIQRVANEVTSGQRSWSSVVKSLGLLSTKYATQTAGTDENEGAFRVLQEVLDRYGLGALRTWMEQEVRAGRSIQEILVDLRQQPTFKDRFKAIDVRASLGLNPVSPEEIIQYENTARDLMRASGLPKGFYDHNDDFAQLIGKGVSLQSLQDRVENSWSRVMEAPPEVMAAWENLYGIRGRQAMAAFMFDPDNAEHTLREMAATAVVGGAMTSFGFGLQASIANKVGKLDLTDSAVRQGFAQIARLEAVFNESISEGEDLDAMGEGVNAVFDAGSGAEAIRRRVDQRLADFSGGGGMLVQQTGVGAGAAD